jgi:hypothetical protein
MHAPETHELKGDAPQHEHQAGLASIVHDEASPETTPRTNPGVGETSPDVHAQKKREVEWLEAEEVRSRQRREQLTS